MKHPLQQLMATLFVSILLIGVVGCGGTCTSDDDCITPLVCDGYHGVFWDSRSCRPLEGSILCGGQRPPCPEDWECHPEAHVCVDPNAFPDIFDTINDSDTDGTTETVTEPEDDVEDTEASPDNGDLEETKDEGDPEPDPAEVEPDIEIDQTDRTETELPPTCEDHDTDGFPGTGDGCDPRDPTFDCNDGNGDIHPTAQEVCDGEDNDCDRLIDNSDADLVTPPCPLSTGVCDGLRTVCDNGQLLGCTEQDYWLHSTGTYARIEDGNSELCDNLDNDCDDTVDEAMERECYTGEPGTRDKGICRGGIETCSHGTWGACAGEITPDPEGNNINCDGLDNDCDDTVDEECECVYDDLGPVTQPCYTGPNETLDVGICHSGTQECLSNDRWGPCTGDQTPQDEMCANTGDDNNCDGNQDNVPSLGVGCIDDTRDGICRSGEYRCRGDSLECISATPPGDEACDNIGTDDDCNGTLDDIEQLGDDCINEEARGICRDGTLQCRGAALT